MSPLSKAMSPTPGEQGAQGTPVQQFYQDGCVLITGGTGFLGKVLIEKLLRSCPNLSQIVLLIRGKKEANCQQRLENMMDETILKGVSPKNRLKVVAVSGDCTLPGLGLSETDRRYLVDSVTVVFHVAATVRFDEDLATAVSINVVGTRAVLDLAHDMTHLKALVHVSTAYSQCHLGQIEERFYPPQYSPDKLIRLTECVDKGDLDQITPFLLKDSPNTYVYTKSIAEELVRTHSKGIPTAVFRPSIVVATQSEPFPGWIDNLYGPTGVVVATCTGVMRTLHCDPDKVADIVPADYVVNALIATAWRTHLRSQKIETTELQPQVFNFVSSPERPLLWSQFFTLGMRYRLPTIHAVWHPALSLNRHRVVHRLQHFLCHLVPAFLLDHAARAIGKRTNLLKICRKVDRFSDLISYFATRQWAFSNNNTQELWRALSAEDRALLPFTFQDHDWESYFKSYLRGTRTYLLKDDMSTMPRALARANTLYWVHQALRAGMLYLLLRLAWRAPWVRLLYCLLTRRR